MRVRVRSTKAIPSLLASSSVGVRFPRTSSGVDNQCVAFFSSPNTATAWAITGTRTATTLGDVTILFYCELRFEACRRWYCRAERPGRGISVTWHLGVSRPTRRSGAGKRGPEVLWEGWRGRGGWMLLSGRSRNCQAPAFRRHGNTAGKTGGATVCGRGGPWPRNRRRWPGRSRIGRRPARRRRTLRN